MASKSICRFTGLQILDLDNIDALTTIKISSQKLTKLSILECINLDEETLIDAPNLIEVEYSNNKLPFYSLGASSLLKVEFNFSLGQADDKTMWFKKLKELFRKVNHMEDVMVAILSLNDQVNIYISLPLPFKHYSFPYLIHLHVLYIFMIFIQFIIVHEKISKSLFHILYNLDALELDLEVAISSRSCEFWEPLLFSTSWKNIFVVSSTCSSNFSMVRFKYIISQSLLLFFHFFFFS